MLPFDVREMIYEYLVTCDGIVRIQRKEDTVTRWRPSDQHDLKLNVWDVFRRDFYSKNHPADSIEQFYRDFVNDRLHLDIFSTCRTVHREARGIFFKHNTFVFTTKTAFEWYKTKIGPASAA